MAYYLKYESKNGDQTIRIRNTKTSELLEKTELENIDMVTCNYKDQSSFLENLYKQGRITELPNGKVYIISNKSTAKPKKAIFGNEMLKYYAIELYNARKNRIPKKDIHLSITNDLVLFRDKLINYALSDETRKLTLSTKKFPFVIKEEMLKLSSLSRRNFNTQSELLEIKQIKERILNMLTRYDTLREAIIFDEFMESKRKNEKIVELEQISLFDDIKDTNKKIEALKDLEEDLKRIAEEKKEEQIIKEHEIENEEIAKWYYIGGLEAVLNNVDTNILYDSSTRDLEAIGIKVKKKIS